MRAKPRSMRRVIWPRSSQTVARDRFVEEAAVVADDDERRAAAVEFAFQPFDGRRGRDGWSARRAAGCRARAPARARAPRGALRRRRAARGLRRREGRAAPADSAALIGVVARAEPGLDIGQRRGEAGEVRLLRQIADGRAGLHEARAAVGLDQAGGDLQQRRFARAVAADQADALARRHRQLDARQQRRAAEGQRDVFQLDQRRRHLWNSTLVLRGLLGALALDASDGLIERRQKRRTVARREGSGTAGHLAR